MSNSRSPGAPGTPGSNVPASAPGLMPRRTSYASVVSGAASVPQGHQGGTQARTGGFSHILNSATEIDSDIYQEGGTYNYEPPRRPEMNTRRTGSHHGGSSWRTTPAASQSNSLPSYSNKLGQEYLAGANPDPFFVPSYLRGSKYVQKLEKVHRARAATRREGSSQTQLGTLSTSSSSANLHGKSAPSHRGMTYDLIEKAPPLPDESVIPLPTKWNAQDKYGGLEVLGDGSEVKFTGSRPAGERDHEASCIRADNPMPPQCGIYYFEVSIMSRKREESSIGIGFSSRDVPLSRPLGWEPDSWAYHGDDGHSFGCHSNGKHYGPSYSSGDVIGCGVNFRKGCAFFTKNGHNLGIAFRDIKGRLFPSVGMRRTGEHVRVNFGQHPFIFDIDGMMRVEKHLLREEVVKSTTAKLAPALSETSFIQSLILQYLSHDGYVETARAFAKEVQRENQALVIDTSATIPLSQFSNLKEDEDAVSRQRIRTAILDGDVDKALKLTNAYYPTVLKDDEHIYFRLRSRKFIEMIRHAAEIRQASLTSNGKQQDGHNGDWYDDVINHDMELDESIKKTGHDRMDTDTSGDSQQDYYNMLNETIAYGQTLTMEFEHDPRREVKKSLEEAFALLAYEDPINAKEVSHLLKKEGRVTVAEELNAAILVSLGKSSSAALERLIQQTTILIEDLREGGGPGSIINVDEYMQPQPRDFWPQA